MCFRIPNNLEKASQVLKITGDLPQLGSLLHAHEMKLVYKKQKNSDVKEQYWEMEIVVHPSEKEITYCYFAYDKENKSTLFERKKHRRIHFSFLPFQKIETDDDFSLNVPKNNYTSSESNLKNNCYKIYDFDFQNKFLFNEINENIILGKFFKFF